MLLLILSFSACESTTHIEHESNQLVGNCDHCIIPTITHERNITNNSNQSINVRLLECDNNICQLNSENFETFLPKQTSSFLNSNNCQY